MGVLGVNCLGRVTEAKASTQRNTNIINRKKHLTYVTKPKRPLLLALLEYIIFNSFVL